MAITPLLSRVEEILAGSNVTPMSRIEVLLVELINYIETGLSSVFHYRGSVQAYSDLSSITNPEVGDVYNVIADGMDYAWTGEAWDSLGTLVIVASEITPDGQAPVTSQAIYNALATKVDKINGKGLSTNDFTDALLQKLTDIAAGAEVNVQSDWNEADSTADDFIKNKPTLGTAAAKGFDVSPTSGNTNNAVSSDGVYRALSDKAKLRSFNTGGSRALRLTFVSGNNRGNLLLSVGMQNDAKVPAIILVNVRADGFLTATNITPNADSIISSVSISGDKSYIDVTLTTDSTWTQPTILSLMDNPPEVAVSWL